MGARVRQLLERLEMMSDDLYQKDFLLTWEHSRRDIETILVVAEALEELSRMRVAPRVFHSGLAVSCFRDKSTRTRFAFAGAADLLGLTVQAFDESTSQAAHGESVRETATMISFLTEVIGIRNDLVLGAGHQYMVEVARSVEDSFRHGALQRRPSIINLQCDLDHPTQVLSDLLHLVQRFGSIEALRGKTMGISWAHSPSYGKPLSVPQGLMCLMTRFGMNVTLAHPPGYSLVPTTLEMGGRFAQESGGSFRQVEHIEEAFRDADVVYPKSWAPYHLMEQRAHLCGPEDVSKIVDLERECVVHNARFRRWECDEKMIALTRNGAGLYMHCLPADISGTSCESGEVEGSVFDRYRLETYRQASHKPFVIAALMLLTRHEHPTPILAELLEASETKSNT